MVDNGRQSSGTTLDGMVENRARSTVTFFLTFGLKEKKIADETH
jgi:hypothetical protein